MNIEKMREEFEAAYLADITARHGAASATDDNWLEKNSNGDYRSFRAAGAWWAWQASRESLVIELPKSRTPAGRGYIDNCREAIEAQGLKVKS